MSEVAERMQDVLRKAGRKPTAEDDLRWVLTHAIEPVAHPLTDENMAELRRIIDTWLT